MSSTIRFHRQVRYSFPPPGIRPSQWLTLTASETDEAEASFAQLIEALSSAGFATEVRKGHKSSLLVFVKLASDRLLKTQVYRTRVQDW